jgi:uncharacterized membrane protein
MASKFVGVRVPEDLVEGAQAAADLDRRSLSNYIVTLIANDLAAREAAGQSLVKEEGTAYGKAAADKSSKQRAKKAS